NRLAGPAGPAHPVVTHPVAARRRVGRDRAGCVWAGIAADEAGAVVGLEGARRVVEAVAVRVRAERLVDAVLVHPFGVAHLDATAEHVLARIVAVVSPAGLVDVTVVIPVGVLAYAALVRLFVAHLRHARRLDGHAPASIGARLPRDTPLLTIAEQPIGAVAVTGAHRDRPRIATAIVRGPSVRIR